MGCGASAQKETKYEAADADPTNPRRPTASDLKTGDEVYDPHKDDPEEEEEEDDDVEDDVEPPPVINRGARQSVSAEAYGAWNKPVEYTAPKYEKTDDQRKRIVTAMSKSFIFRTLDEDSQEAVVLAMKEKTIAADTVVITQGAEVVDNEDGLFMLETGEMNVFKRKPDEEGDGAHVFTYKNPGDSFGELALLYNCPRAATVKAANDCSAWVLTRADFNGLVKGAIQKKREQYVAFLQSVPLLQSLGTDAITKLSDCLSDHKMDVGQTIVKEGEAGDTFYIVAEGECEATTAAGAVMKYGAKDFFGELALKSGSDGVRKATVTCKTAGKTVTIDRATFTRLLGPLDSVMQERETAYAKANAGS